MNCDDVANGIYVYLDGEFAPPEEKDFELHLESCPRCRALAERDAAFLSWFKESVATDGAPEGLRGRIEAAIDAQAAPRESSSAGGGVRARWLIPLAAAAALLLAGSWMVSHFTGADNVVVSGAVAAHQGELPMEVRGSTDQIRQFLQENVPFAVQVPFADRDDLKLVGARLTQVRGSSAVVFNYEMAGKRLSVLQLADDQDEDPEPQVVSRQGYQVVTYRDRGVTNSMVGNFGSGEMLRLVPASYRR